MRPTLLIISFSFRFHLACRFPSELQRSADGVGGKWSLRYRESSYEILFHLTISNRFVHEFLNRQEEGVELHCEGHISSEFYNFANSESVKNGSTNLQMLFENADLKPKLTFIGGGKMATALISGFESAGLITKDDVAVSVRRESSAQRWKQLGYENVYTSSDILIRDHGQGIVFLSVKPEMRTAVLNELSNNAFINTPLIISVMGGVDVKTLEREVAAKGYILERGLVRLMPNLPVTVCSGASVMCYSSYLQQEKCMMHHVGICSVISEKSFDAATAIAGCGPAFIFMAIEALSDGGVLGGIDRTTSIKLAAQTVMGAAKMVLEGTKHPATLKDDVCSAGGSTIYGVKELEKNGFRSALIEAVHASTKRSSGHI